MGKMKEKFMEEQEKALNDEIDAFIDDDYQLEEYYASIKPEDDCCGGDCHCKGEPATQKESQANHDAWWNSLTDEQKQQLYLDQEESINESNDEYLNHWLKNKDNESR